MGLLSSILTAPVTGPLRGSWWVMNQILAAAEAEVYDEDRIVAEIRALAIEYEEGRISAEEHAAAEELLLDRLMEARAWRAQRNQETL